MAPGWAPAGGWGRYSWKGLRGRSTKPGSLAIPDTPNATPVLSPSHAPFRQPFLSAAQPPNMPSLFESVELAPRDPILGLNEQYNADPRNTKVNLGVGVYFDDQGRIPLLKAVQQAEAERVKVQAARGYLPMEGIAAYNKAAQVLLFGKDSPLLDSGRLLTAQSLGGTGALKIGADFLKQILPNAKVVISNPSWENHRALFERAGFTVENYPYYDAATRGLDFNGMLAAL